MKVINDTKYDSKLLRKIICQAHNACAKYEGPYRRWKFTKIRVRRRISSDPRNTSGHAYLEGTYSCLTLPAPKCSTRKLFDLAWHEIMHLYGYRHKQFSRYPDDKTAAEFLKDVPEFLEEVVKEKVKVDVQDARYQNVLSSIKGWETKAKRAKTALTKLYQKKKYYETQFAARAVAEVV